MPRPEGLSTANASLIPEPGSLYVVATPLGNLTDISERAIAILEKVSLIACEDTRVSGKLLSKLEIDNRTVSYHENNERTMAPKLAEALAQGKSVALISDAGTPGLSDPGFRLTRECRKRGFPVVPVPGPCAAIALLSVSGLPSDRFLFIGFLPPKSAARRRFLESNKDLDHSIIVYESCRRIEKLFSEMLELLGPDRFICIGREITKRFESIHTASLGELETSFEQSSKKGEFTIVIAPGSFTL